MAKKKAAAKITAEELKNIQDRVSDINRLQMQHWWLRSTKKRVAVGTLNELFTRFFNGRSEEIWRQKYGKVSVNLNDGSLKPSAK